MNPPPVDQPTSHRLLTAAQAIALANQARALRTGSSGSGEINCPADDEQATVIAFAFPQGDVDLWWWTTGCQSVDNGSITAFMGTLTLPKP
jgi:hypothetical protein